MRAIDERLLPRVFTAAGREYGVLLSALVGRRTDQSAAWPRMVAFYLARHGGASMRQIGRFCGRDHSTVVHDLRRVRDRIETEPDQARRVARLLEEMA